MSKKGTEGIQKKILLSVGVVVVLLVSMFLINNILGTTQHQPYVIQPADTQESALREDIAEPGALFEAEVLSENHETRYGTDIEALSASTPAPAGWSSPSPGGSSPSASWSWSWTGGSSSPSPGAPSPSPGAPSPSPGTPSPSPGAPSPSPANRQLIEQFVSRMYNLTVQRLPDASGLNFWTNHLVNRTMTGTEVGRGFMFSNEMNNRNLNNTQFINILYDAFFGRSADDAGRTFWLGRMEAGWSRLQVFNSFAHSPEFERIAADFGIQR